MISINIDQNISLLEEIKRQEEMPSKQLRKDSINQA